MMHDRDRWSLTDRSLDSLPNELPWEGLEVGAPSTCRCTSATTTVGTADRRVHHDLSWSGTSRRRVQAG